MISYDKWKLAHDERDEEPPFPCVVCTGEEDAVPCSEECAELVAKVERERRIQGCRQAARLVLKLAKSYRREGFPEDHRIELCIRCVHYYRGQIRGLRAA